MSDAAATVNMTINGVSVAVSARTLAALLEERGVDPGGRGLALALNGSVVPRSAWKETALSAGDAVEIVHAKQGG